MKYGVNTRAVVQYGAESLELDRCAMPCDAMLACVLTARMRFMIGSSNGSCLGLKL